MAIERKITDGIGVQSGLQTSTKFRTELPDPGAAMQAGVDKLTNIGLGIGREGMADEASKAAKDAANSAMITKDPDTGMFNIPQAPASFGPAAAKIFDTMVEDKTQTQAYYDYQDKAAQIAADNQNDPVKARALLEAHAQGVLKAQDPRIAGRLQGPLFRDMTERSNSILATTKAKDDTALANDAAQNTQDANQRMQDAISIGNKEAADEHKGIYERSLDTLIRLHKLAPEAKDRMMQSTLKSNAGAGTLLHEMKLGYAAGAVSPEDLQDLTRLVDGNFAPGEKIKLGDKTYDATWIYNNMPDPDARKALSANLQRMRALTTDKWNGRMKDMEYDAAAQVYDHGASGPIPKWSGEKMADHIDQWAKRTGVDINTGDGLQAAVKRFGYVPEKIVKDVFDGVRTMDDNGIKARWDMYQHLDKLVDRDGNKIVNMQGVLDPKDRAFMVAYAQGGFGSADSQKRKADAVAMVNAGFTGDKDSLDKILLQHGYASREDIDKELANPMGDWLPGRKKLEDLTADQRQFLRITAAKYAASTGLKAQDAVKMAKEDFQQRYVSAPMLVEGNASKGGLVDKKLVEGLSITTATDPKKPTTEWMNPYLRANMGLPEERPQMRPITTAAGTPVFNPDGTVKMEAIPSKELKAAQPQGPLAPGDTWKPAPPRPRAKYIDGNNVVRDIPDDVHTGVDGNLFLQSSSTPGGYLVQYKDARGLYRPVLDPETSKVMTVFPGRAAAAQQEYQNVEMVKRAGTVFGDKIEAQGISTPGGIRSWEPSRAPVNLNDFRAPSISELPGNVPDRISKSSLSVSGKASIGLRVDDGEAAKNIEMPRAYAPRADLEPVKAVAETVSNTAAVAVDYFQKRGYTKAQTAGILGNLIIEGTEKGGPKMSPTAVGSGGDFGIAQWIGTRRVDLEKFAKENDLKARDLGTQLAFIEHELGGKENSTKQALAGATNPAEATAAFMGFERPRGFSPKYPEAHPSWSARVNTARKIFALIGGDKNG